ncbi:hypothetical protein [Leeuwenhoekiella sp. W20_SRS_FM14]|uniref:hypothetical protein n=1 Tax=Leeuwenhoekiella sp. W20_SRS_FM14 TaxID=3240270 RepID=UPI003F9A07A6
MKINSLNTRPNSEEGKHKKQIIQFKELLDVLNERKLPEFVIQSINKEVDHINGKDYSDKQLYSLLRTSQRHILKLVDKETGIVPNNHYRNLWLALGMSVFGIPLGVAFGAALGNMGLLEIGLPIGMAIGIALGVQKDKKAQAEGKQLNLEIK